MSSLSVCLFTLDAIYMYANPFCWALSPVIRGGVLSTRQPSSMSSASRMMQLLDLVSLARFAG